MSGLTDAQLNALEAAHNGQHGLTDDQLNALQRTHQAADQLRVQRQQLPSSRVIDLLKRQGQLAISDSISFAMQPMGKIIDLLSRSDEATTAGIRHGLGAGWNTFLHSEPQTQYQHDTAEITRHMMRLTPQQYAQLPGWKRGSAEFATQTLTDPITYIDPLVSGGRGLAVRAGKSALPMLMRAAEAAERSRLPGLATATEAARHYATKAHNFMTGGGENAAHALREEALRNGPAGVDNWRRLYSLRGASDAMSADVANALSTGFNRAIEGLNSQERLSVYRAIHNGTIESLPDNLKNAAKQIVAYDRAIPYLGGSQALRKQMQTLYGYTLPKDLQRFDIGTAFTPSKARGVVRTNNFLEQHIPLPHEATPEEIAALERNYTTFARPKRDAASTRNLQFQPRRPTDPDMENPLTISDPNLIEELFHGSFKRAGRQIAAADLQQQVAQLFGNPRQLNARLGNVTREDLERATKLRTNSNHADLSLPARRKAPAVPAVPARQGTATVNRYADVPSHIRNMFVDPGKPMAGNAAVQQINDLLKGASDLSRSTMFYNPLPHAMRIGSLLALHAPEAIPSALGKFLRAGVGFASPERQAEIYGAARHAGATGLPNVEQSRLVDLLNKGGPIGKTAGLVYNTSGKMLWGWDNAAKAALYERNLKQYGDPLLAAYHTQQSLVNYERPSQFIEGARMLSSFPTWRVRMPMAVLKGIAEHPRNAAMLARLNGGALFGAPFSMDGEQRKMSSSALGEAAELVDDPRAYVRGSLSPTGKLAASALTALLAHGKGADPQYWTYNKPAGQYILNELPVLNQILPYTGYGMFSGTPQDQALMQLLGIQTLHPFVAKHHARHHRRRVP